MKISSYLRHFNIFNRFIICQARIVRIMYLRCCKTEADFTHSDILLCTNLLTMAPFASEISSGILNLIEGSLPALE